MIQRCHTFSFGHYNNNYYYYYYYCGFTVQEYNKGNGKVKEGEE